MSWSDPGADPLADLRRMAEQMEKPQPQAILVPTRAYVHVMAWSRYPGRWPWQAVRRMLWRRAELARWGLGPLPRGRRRWWSL